MPLTANQRKEIVDDLTTNCECWQGEGDRETLNRMSDEKLQQLQAHAQTQAHAVSVANAAVNGFQAKDGNAYRLNPETGKWEMRPATGALKDSISNQTANAKKKAAKQEDPPEEEEEEEAEEETEDKKKSYNVRSGGPAFVDQYLRGAPKEVQDLIRSAQTVEKREKDKIIFQLLANVAEADKQAHYQRLSQRSLEDLSFDLAMVPKAPTSEDLSKVTPPRRTRINNRQAQDDVLALPVMDWQEMSGNGSSSKQQTSNSGQDEGEDDLAANGEDPNKTDEDYINSLPPRLRSAVQNAVVIEAREKRKLIDQLTENVGDDEAEKKLRARLSGKSLDELRDLIALAPRRQEPPRTNYFGAAAPAANARTQSFGNDHNEEVLIPQTIDWVQNSKTA